MNTIQKFQELLKNIFQFEISDLDFGIYRILNYKREQIEKFIQKDLIDKVESVLTPKLGDHTVEIRYIESEFKKLMEG
jgi:adenine-specific DNA-methyltransferase